MKNTINFKSLNEINKLETRELKKHLTEVMGHKVNEIVSRMTYGKDGMRVLLIRFRHEIYAYSNMHIFQEENELKYTLENFETKELNEILRVKY